MVCVGGRTRQNVFFLEWKSSDCTAREVVRRPRARQKKRPTTGRLFRHLKKRTTQDLSIGKGLDGEMANSLALAFYGCQLSKRSKKVSARVHVYCILYLLFVWGVGEVGEGRTVWFCFCPLRSLFEVVPILLGPGNSLLVDPVLSAFLWCAVVDGIQHVLHGWCAVVGGISQRASRAKYEGVPRVHLLISQVCGTSHEL